MIDWFLFNLDDIYIGAGAADIVEKQNDSQTVSRILKTKIPMSVICMSHEYCNEAKNEKERYSIR